MEFTLEQKRFLATALQLSQAKGSDDIQIVEAASKVGMSEEAARDLCFLMGKEGLVITHSLGALFRAEGKHVASLIQNELLAKNSELTHKLLIGLYKAASGSTYKHVDLVPIGEKEGIDAASVARLADRVTRLSRPPFVFKLNDANDTEHYFTCITERGIEQARNSLPPEKTKKDKVNAWLIERFTKIIDSTVSVIVTAVVTAVVVGPCSYIAGRKSIGSSAAPASQPAAPASSAVAEPVPIPPAPATTPAPESEKPSGTK